MNPFDFYQLFQAFFKFLYYMLFIRVILSWIPHNPYNPAIQFIYRMSDPLLKPFQNAFPMSGIDLSPIFAFIALGMIKRLLLMIFF